MPFVITAPPKLALEGEYTAYDLLYTFPGLTSNGADVTLFFDDDNDILYIHAGTNQDIFVIDLKTGNITYQNFNAIVSCGYQPDITAPQATLTGKYSVYVDNGVSPSELVILKKGVELTRINLGVDADFTYTTFISPKGKYVGLVKQKRGFPPAPGGDVMIWKGL